jgi:hypothetical protein
MTGRERTESLLVRRKLTRAIAEMVKASMTGHLETLAPLLRPTTVLGDYIEGGTKESSRRAEKAFKELQGLYEQIASSKPYNLSRELPTPLRLTGVGLEITAVDTAYVIESGSQPRTIMVRSPLTWTLTYGGYAPSRIPDLLKGKARVAEDVAQLVVAYLLMHVVTMNSPGLLQVFEALHFPVTSVTVPEFGALPMTRIAADIVTERPSDDVILESAEMTGMDAFEEVVRIQDLTQLRDPLKDRVLDIARQHVPELV